MELAERAEDQEEQLVEDALNDARARIEDADEDEAVEDLQRGVEEAEEEDRFVREVEDCLRRTSE
jgi:vacuolar-type H+-ATPase subunit H